MMDRGSARVNSSPGGLRGRVQTRIDPSIATAGRLESAEKSRVKPVHLKAFSGSGVPTYRPTATLCGIGAQRKRIE